MKRYEQFYISLNGVLLLKLLQLVAMCGNTIAWVNIFTKIILKESKRRRLTNMLTITLQELHR